ncbi:hypothetical protein T11_13606 [Trichinella zimbabwensis]|uniref:Uncharacterized protein n=1 Tax=Trichinella zimbabwensis TaxID=268475 RepID=A0A0V1G8E5_9BILA|nr:hypothetical protein T11_13606 [Trichinella zimbabwensis]
MLTEVESPDCLCFSVAGASVRLINVASNGLGKAWKFLCCAMNCTLNFES